MAGARTTEFVPGFYVGENSVPKNLINKDIAIVPVDEADLRAVKELSDKFVTLEKTFFRKGTVVKANLIFALEDNKIKFFNNKLKRLSK